MKRLCWSLGTRPEAIKCAYLQRNWKKRPGIDMRLRYWKFQHRQMLDQVLETFHVVPDYDLSIMKNRLSLMLQLIFLRESEKVLDIMKIRRSSRTRRHDHDIHWLLAWFSTYRFLLDTWKQVLEHATSSPLSQRNLADRLLGLLQRYNLHRQKSKLIGERR